MNQAIVLLILSLLLEIFSLHLIFLTLGPTQLLILISDLQDFVFVFINPEIFLQDYK